MPAWFLRGLPLVGTGIGGGGAACGGSGAGAAAIERRGGWLAAAGAGRVGIFLATAAPARATGFADAFADAGDFFDAALAAAGLPTFFAAAGELFLGACLATGGPLTPWCESLDLDPRGSRPISVPGKAFFCQS